MSKGVGITRREFLKIAGITGLLIGVTGISYKTLKKAEELSLAAAQKPSVKYTPSRCGMCPQGCSIMVRSYNGRAERIIGNPYGFVFNRGTICARGNMGIYRLYNPDRLMYPLIRTPGSKRGEWAFQATNWTKAYKEVISTLKEKISAGETRKILWFTGWATCDLYRALILSFLMAGKFPNVLNQPLGTCFLPKALGWSSVIGVGSHEEIMTDFDDVQYLIVLRRNHAGSITVSHGSRVGQNMRRFKLVVIDPRMSEEAARADEWIPIRPGTDLALLLAMMHVILNEKLYDADYLREYTNAPMLVDPETLEPYEITKTSNGKIDFKVWDLAQNKPVWSREAKLPALEGEYEIDGKKYIPVLEALKRHLNNKGYTPEWAEKITDVPAEKIYKIAREFGTIRPSAIDTGWHGTKTYNSFQTWRAVALLNALVGSPLRRGGILLSHAGLEQTKHPMSLGAPKISDVYKALAEEEFTLSDGSKTKGVVVNLGRNYIPLKKIILEGNEKGWVFFAFGANPARTMLDAEGWLEQVFTSNKVDKVIFYDVLPQDTSLYADIIINDCVYLERYDRIRPVDFVPYKAVYTAVPAVHPPVADCVSAYDFFALAAKDLGFGKEFATILGKMWLGLDDAHTAQLVNVVETEMDYTILSDKNKRGYFAKRMQEIQADQLAKQLGKSSKEVLEYMRTKGFLVLAGKEEVLKENLELLEKGELNTPTGKVEIFSFMLLEAGVKAKGGVKPEWHPLIDWVPPRALQERPKLGPDEFYLIYGKAPTMTHTHTADNPLLSVVLTEESFKRIWIHPSRAAQLGLKEGDLVEVCNSLGKCYKTRVHITELIRPDTAFYVNAWGHESPRLRFTPKETIPWNKLVVTENEPIAGSAILGDTFVKIRKA